MPDSVERLSSPGRILDPAAGELTAAATFRPGYLGRGAHQLACVDPCVQGGPPHLHRKRRRTDHDGNAVAVEPFGVEPIGCIDDAVTAGLCVDHRHRQAKPGDLFHGSVAQTASRRCAPAGLLELTRQALELLLQTGNTIRHLFRPRFQSPSRRLQRGPRLLPATLGCLARDHVDATYALPDAGFRGDDRRADVTGVLDVGPAAQLARPAAEVDHPDELRVALIDERYRAT